MRWNLLPVLLSFGLPVCAAVCDPLHFPGGAYGFQLTGTPMIAGSAKAAVAVGRIALDGQGGLNGYSSVNFGGWYLGNPVTGTYSLQVDCSLTFRLQDDSGNFQNFAGILDVDLTRGKFHQTDAGADTAGSLMKIPDQCSGEDFRPQYRLRLSGTSVALDTGAAVVEMRGAGSIEASGGSLTFHPEDASIPPATGSYSVGSDCFAELELAVPNKSGPGPIRKFRGILTRGGLELRAIETDPATAVTLILTVP